MKKQKDITPNKTIPQTEAKPDIVLVAGILFLTFLAFWPSLNNGLIFWDDPEYILNNPYTKSFNLREIFSAYYMGNYHPLTLLSYAIEYKLFGMNIFMFHLDNLLLHMANTFLVFIFVFRLFKTNNFYIAPIAAILFGIHPMHVESVAWLSERKDVLHAFFYLLALLSYLNYLQKEKNTVWLLAAFILTLLSLLSKGQAVSLPFIFLLMDYLNNTSEKSMISKKDIISKVPFFILSAVFGYLAIEAQKAEGAINYAVNNSNIFYGFFAVFIYVFKLIIPINLSGFHPYPPSASPIIYFGLLIIPIVIYLTIKTYKKHKVVFFGLMFFLLSIAPMLKFVPVGDAFIAERYTYIPYIGLFIIAGYGFEKLSIRFKNSVRLLQSAMVLVVLLFSFLTFSYSKVYKDSNRFWANVTKQYPDNWRGNHCLGKTYYDVKDYDKAIVYFSRAIDRDKNCPPIPYLWRGITYLEKLNNPQAAMSDLSIVIKLDDRANVIYREGLLYLGLAYYRARNYDSAMFILDQLLPLIPQDGRLHNYRGLTLAAQQKYREAIAEYSKAIEFKKDFAEAFLNRGILYSNEFAEYDKAIEDFKKVLILQPDNLDAAINIGVSYYKKGETEAAINQYNSIIVKNPDMSRAYYLRALAFAAKKDYGNARKDGLEARKLGMSISDETLNSWR